MSTFFWSWFDVVPFGTAIFQQVNGATELFPMMLSLAVSVVVLAVFAGFAGLRKGLLRTRTFGLLSLVFGAGGAALWFAGLAELSTPMLVAAGVLVGVYEACGIMVSGSIATCQGTTNALIHIAVALPLNLVPILLIAFLQPGAAVVLACLLPLFSTLGFAAYAARSANRTTLLSVLATQPVLRRKPTGKGPALLRTNGNFLAIVLMVTLGFGMVNVETTLATGNNPFDEYFPLAIRAFMSAAVLFGYLRFSWNPQMILTAAVVVMAVALIGSAVVDSPPIHWAFLAAYICFDLLIWAVIISLNYGSGRPLFGTICMVQAIDQLGIFGGSVAVQVWTQPQAHAVLYAAFGVGALLLVMVLLVSNRAVIEPLAAADFDFTEGEIDMTGEVAAGGEPARVASSSQQEGAGAMEAVPSASQQSVLDDLATRFFLSDREKDILQLLTEGRSGPYIADKLCISGNTVKTHIRHIYTKLDVHDRQELLDLVRETQA